MLTSASFSKTRTSPRWSPASSSPTASSHDRASSSRSTRGLHAPGRSLSGSVCVGHGLSSKVQLVVLWWFQGLPANFLLQRKFPVATHVLHAPSPVTALPVAEPVLDSVYDVFVVFSFLFTVYLCDASMLLDYLLV
jgi:hypothetical protein